MGKVSLETAIESWPLAETFVISRGAKTAADVIVVTLRRNGVIGRGECVPYARYGESVEIVIQQIEEQRSVIEQGLSRDELQEAMKPGAARNAIDCAMWDLEAKEAKIPVWRLAGLKPPEDVTTAYTISLGTPAEMAAAAQRNRHRPLIKLKLTGHGDVERVAAVRKSAPKSAIIVDANEGWQPEMIEPFSRELHELDVTMIEQPLPTGEDSPLSRVNRLIPVCADESSHTSRDVQSLADRYDMVNIKLDKTGGLTEALKMREAAQAVGLKVMVGCMVGTSLSMAPAMLVAQGADIVDLDGPLILEMDRYPGLAFNGSSITPPEPNLWG